MPITRERVEELLKAARERLNGPPGARTIGMHPEEVLELLEDGLKVVGDPAPQPAQPEGNIWSYAGSQADAIGRIAAAYIAKQPPNLKAEKVAAYVAEVIVSAEGKING